MRKIVVVTPVKNEEWILERFLTVTSLFADHILVADQQSVDRSRVICARFPKVHVVENNSPTYDENHRQRLLLDSARKLVPEERFILALDADEILAADGLSVPAWSAIHSAAPGTGFYFEKPDLMPSLTACRRGKTFFPLGFVDDNAKQTGKLIHSMRIPLRTGHARIEMPEVKFIHLALVRPAEYRARQRHYSVIENVNRTKSLRQRLAYYSPAVYESALYANTDAVPPSWFQGWLQRGISFETFPSTELNQYNQQVLAHLNTHGAARFFYDDIWDIDWAELAARLRHSSWSNDAAAFCRPRWYHHTVRRCLIRLLRLRHL